MSLPHQPGCACCTLPSLSSQLDELQHHNWTESLASLIRTAAERAKLALHQDAAIFHGGPIYTLQGGQPGRVEALGIVHGKVMSVGSLRQVETDMQAHPRAERIDLRGKTLLPGMIDPHMHILPSALYRNWINLCPFEGQTLRPGYNLGWIAGQLREQLPSHSGHTLNGAQRWLTGFGVDPSLMTEWQEPDLDFLDSISSEVPIFLINASGHLGYANSAAVKLAGLDPKDKGVTTEADVGKVLTVIPGLAAPHILAKIQEILHDAAANGITTLFDAGLGAGLGPLEITLLRAFAQSPLAPVRIGAALYCNQDWMQEQWLQTYQLNHNKHDDDRFSVRALKLIADGSNQGLTGYQSQDYCCAGEHHVPGVSPRGLFNFEPPITFAAQLQRALNAGWPVLVHANGDQAVDYVLAGFELALYDEHAKDGAPNPKLALRSRIEHCSLLSDASIATMARLKLSPSFLIGHVGYWGQVFKTTILGRERAQMLDRCQSALKAGLRISLHSDHFVSPLGTLRMMEQAVTRVMEADPERQPLNPAECLDRIAALRAVTLDAAWQCHMDHIVGSLEPGKLADLAILEQDPLDPAVPVGTLRDIRVHQTWLAGKPVYQNPKTH
ncbi:amidohydrolase [Chromobacterium alkanivorans]|uniref:amidohydrolase n=1 Tax=Chromobacterium alkanivorans TaxID=1071719 RepID=UPI001967740B|nr:amidohydrolase [Chromobacterium alkanivorans]MBN3004150.1 amidohydrolase [Chromobacterium alkanivorans]